uniref:Uncharacterized protein n=2 Tax=Tanacetum cinerariifolium TaxID=118510 RepID=A0A699ILB8_TANCI|nr:hypothetical protein [Tanacetum cinerariifolium]
MAAARQPLAAVRQPHPLLLPLSKRTPPSAVRHVGGGFGGVAGGIGVGDVVLLPAADGGEGSSGGGGGDSSGGGGGE